MDHRFLRNIHNCAVSGMNWAAEDVGLAERAVATIGQLFDFIYLLKIIFISNFNIGKLGKRNWSCRVCGFENFKRRPR
jgi:hypothetical protein